MNWYATRFGTTSSKHRNRSVSDAGLREHSGRQENAAEFPGVNGRKAARNFPVKLHELVLRPDTTDFLTPLVPSYGSQVSGWRHVSPAATGNQGLPVLLRGLTLGTELFFPPRR